MAADKAMVPVTALINWEGFYCTGKSHLKIVSFDDMYIVQNANHLNVKMGERLIPSTVYWLYLLYQLDWTYTQW